MTPITWNGEPIAKPGLYRGIGMEAYHGQLTTGPSVSSSGLRTIFTASPAHYFVESYLNPDREEQEASQAFIFGRGAHHLLLGEEDFARYFVVRPEKLNGTVWNSNRTDCKEWLAGAAEAGLTVLLPAQIAAIRGMARGLAAHPLIGAGILNGLIEHSMVWQDAETGVWLKVRPDAIPNDAADFADLKTTVSVSHDALTRTIGEYGYQVQAALVGMACREVLGREMTSFSLVFSEKTPPHCARVVTLKPSDIELGEQQARMAIRMFARCVERGDWPGPGGTQSDAEYIELPTWSRGRIETRMALLEQELAA